MPIHAPMWLDALVLAVLAGFALVGALRGALRSALALLGLAAAYGAALGAASRAGPRAAEALGSSEAVGAAAAGTAAFLLTLIAVGILGRILRRWDRGRRERRRSAGDRFGGAVLGALRGGLVATLLSLLAIHLDFARTAGVAEIVPPIGGSAAAALTADAVESGLAAALADAGPAGRLVARAAARPAGTYEELRTVIAHPSIAALQEDPLFWSYVEHGAVDAALNTRSFLAVCYDDGLRARLAELGILSQAAAADPSVFGADAREAFLAIGPHVRALREDPEVRGLLADPAIVAALREGDTLALAANADFRRVVARVTSAATGDGPPAGPQGP